MSGSRSQFLHEEQGALLTAATVAHSVPDMKAKYYAGAPVLISLSRYVDPPICVSTGDRHSRDMNCASVEASCERCPTRRVCLAADLATSEMMSLHGVLTPSPPIAQHKHVYRAGDMADRHYHVRSGIFKTYAVNAAGDEYVTGFYYPGDLIGCAYTDGVYADSALTLETGTVCALRVHNLSELCDIGLGPTLLKLLADREVQAARHQLNLTQPRADARLAGWLVQVSERISRLGWCPNRIPAPMSRTDLASYLGMTLESLSRAFTRFNKAGLIRATRKHVDLLKPETIATFGYHAVP